MSVCLVTIFFSSPGAPTISKFVGGRGSRGARPGVGGRGGGSASGGGATSGEAGVRGLAGARDGWWGWRGSGGGRGDRSMRLSSSYGQESGLPHARCGASRAPARGPAMLVASRGSAWLRRPLRRRSGEGRRRVGAACRRERRGA